MGKGIGKFGFTLFVFFFAYLSAGILTACKAQPRSFYTLKEAYRMHILSREDLQAIAESKNADRSGLGENVLQAMKEDYLPILEGKMISQYTAENIILDTYWGEYHGIYVVQLAGDDFDFLQPILTLEIDGVKIEYTGPEPLAYRYD